MTGTTATSDPSCLTGPPPAEAGLLFGLAVFAATALVLLRDWWRQRPARAADPIPTHPADCRREFLGPPRRV